MAKKDYLEDEVNVNDAVGTETEKVDEALAEKNRKKEEAKKDRAKAKEIVRKFIGETEDEDLKKALMLLVGTGKRSGGSRIMKPNTNQLLHDAFIEKGELTEMDVFKGFRIGRPEMTTKIRIFLKVANPDDRIWVKFFPDEEIYRLIGTGANPPEGWDGFTPTDVEVL